MGRPRLGIPPGKLLSISWKFLYNNNKVDEQHLMVFCLEIAFHFRINSA